MQKRTIQVDHDQKELTVHGSVAFPVSVTYDDLSMFENCDIRCHWHDELEIAIIREGKIHYQIGERSYILHTGEGIVINSDAPHNANPVDGNRAVMLTIIVHPSFLAEDPASDIARKYLQPFVHNQQMPCIYLHADVAWEKHLVQCFYQVTEAYFHRKYAYELKIKALLCEAFFELFTHCPSPEVFTGAAKTQESLRRLQLMLDYLHTNYQEPLSLEKLASHVHASREFCSRFFRHMTGKSLTEYLTDYRIYKSVNLLLDGSYSVVQVSEMAGFSSSSRFAKAFMQRMGMNPKAYQLSKKS